MSGEQLDRQVSELLETVRPALSAGWQQRVSTSVRFGRRRLSRARVVALAAGAAAVVMGLGFVPFPVGTAKGAWARALAAAEQAGSAHIVACRYEDGKEVVTEEWLSADGVSRYEEREGGDLLMVRVRGEGRDLFYFAKEQKGFDYDAPPRPAEVRAELPLDRSQVLAAFDQPGAELTERSERTLWGDTVDVVEVEQEVTVGTLAALGGEYHTGDRVKLRAEIDPQTGRLVALREYQWKHFRWAPRFETTSIEWDVAVPEGLGQLDFPTGTEVVQGRWWTGRVEQSLAEGQTSDWMVALHALDVNVEGDIFVTVSRMRTASNEETHWNGAAPIWIAATDDADGTYSQANWARCSSGYWGGYWLLRLDRQGGGPSPRLVTLTIRPYAQGEVEEEVTFANLPLPARQEGYDLPKEAMETIQH